MARAQHVEMGVREEIKETRKRGCSGERQSGSRSQSGGDGRLASCSCTVGPGCAKGPGVPGAGILGPAGALVAWKDPALLEAFLADGADSFKDHPRVTSSLQCFPVEFRCGF